MKRVAILLVLVGCGGDGTSAGPDAGGDGSGPDAAVDSPGAALALTSPMLTEGATIATANTCDGANTSPQLAWTGNSMNAQSFAVVLTDKTNGLVHAVIYDIPGTATGLPANVEKVYAPTNVAGGNQNDSYTAG